MVKFFVDPFATEGDVVPIPNGIQGNGSVSYAEGWTFNYQRNLESDPAALAIPRTQMNQLFFDITSAIQQYQITSVPDFITTSDNLGSPYSYNKYVIVSYDDGVNGPRNFQSKTDTNVSLPTDGDDWRWDDGSAPNIIYDNVTFDGAVANGDAVYLNAGTGNYTLALADGSPAEAVIGIADVDFSRVYAVGDVPGLSGLTAGALYYLSSTVPGQLTTVVPTLSIIQMGIAKSTTELLLNVAPVRLINVSAIPVGMYGDFGGTTPPPGWLVRDGSAVSRTTYAALFAYIGTIWGAGDGSTTFNLPNSARRSTVGAGGSGTAELGSTVGSLGGEEAHALTEDENGVHDHSITDEEHSHGAPDGFEFVVAEKPDGEWQGGGGTGTEPNTEPAFTGITGTNNSGSGTPHNTYHPVEVVLPCIKY